MNGEGSYFLVKFCRLDDSGVKVLEDMLGERVECRLKIDWGGFSSRVMLYEANREDSSITLILFGLSDRMRHCSEAKLLEAVSESLGGLFELEVSKISDEALASERPDVAKNIFPSLAMPAPGKEWQAASAGCRCCRENGGNRRGIHYIIFPSGRRWRYAAAVCRQGKSRWSCCPCAAIRGRCGLLSRLRWNRRLP